MAAPLEGYNVFGGKLSSKNSVFLLAVLKVRQGKRGNGGSVGVS